MAVAGLYLTTGATWRELRRALFDALAKRPPFPETLLVAGSRLLADSIRLELLATGRATLGLHLLTPSRLFHVTQGLNNPLCVHPTLAHFRRTSRRHVQASARLRCCALLGSAR